MNNIVMKFANESEVDYILENIKNHERQSMNIRTMDGIQLYVLKSDDQILGWIGLSLGHFNNYAEYFSLFVLPEFRGLGLGLLLELQVVIQALNHQYAQLYFRSDSQSSPRLKDKRLSSVEIEVISPTDEVKEMCTHCELHKKTCIEQVFFKMDLERRRTYLQSEILKYPIAQTIDLILSSPRGATTQYATL